MRYKLVMFDFDGTLADSSSWFRETLNEVAEGYNFRKVNDEEIEELRKQRSRDIIRQLRIPIWKLPFIARHMRRLATTNVEHISLFPGIETMLEQLKDFDIRIALVSSNAEIAIRDVLGDRIAASIDYFECGASMFGKARRIRRVVTLSGVASSEAIFIGDETRDLEAASRAGVPGAAVGWGYANTAAFEPFGPIAIFSAVDEMAHFLTVGDSRCPPSSTQPNVSGDKSG